MTDVIIIGGGFPGLVAAIACSKLNLKVQLFDVKDSLKDSQLHAFKPIVLNAASWQLLKALDIAKALESKAHGLKKMHVLRDAWSTFSFDADQRRHPHLGYVVMGADLQNELAKTVEQDQNITCFLNAKIDSIEAGDQPQIHIADKAYAAKLLIVADGRQSENRTKLGMAYTQSEWDKNALVASVELEDACEDAYLRFVSGGTAACIPTASGMHQIILAKQKSDDIFKLDDEALLASLKAHMADICEIKKLHRHMVFPLGQGIASKVAMPGAILLGDAGFAIPPVGAQGLNLAFFDIGVLADILAHAIENEVPFNDEKFSQRYNQTVMPHHDKLLKGVSTLMNLFDMNAIWLQSMHGLALKLANYVSPFKRYVAEFGMGFRYPMPALIRGQIPKIYPKVMRQAEVDSDA